MCKDACNAVRALNNVNTKSAHLASVRLPCLQDEVIEYAKWLGMDTEGDKDLLYIAREGLKVRGLCATLLIVACSVIALQAPLPANWKPCKTIDTEEIYYFNFATGASSWDHPCDEVARPQHIRCSLKVIKWCSTTRSSTTRPRSAKWLVSVPPLTRPRRPVNGRRCVRSLRRSR